MNSHKKAPLTPKGREAMLRSVVEGGLSKVDAARQSNFQSRPHGDVSIQPTGPNRNRRRLRHLYEHQQAEKWSMKALTWHGKSDIRCETVLDPKIEHGREFLRPCRESLLG